MREPEDRSAAPEAKPEHPLTLWLSRLVWVGLLVHVAFLPISIAGMQIGIGVSAIALVAIAALGKRTWAHTALDRPILALCAAATFSVLAAALTGLLPVGWHEATLWRTALAPIAVVSGLALLSADRAEMQRRALLLLALWGAAAVLPSIIAWVQYPTGFDPLHALGMRAIPRQAAAPRDPGHFAAMGFFNWYQRLAHNLTPPICLAAAVAALSPREALSPRLRTWLLIAAGLASTAVGLTFSRSAWVGLAAGFAVIVSFAGLRIARWAMPAALAIAVVLGALTPSVRDRFSNLNNPEYNRDRVTIWNVCAAVVKDHPITGVGWGSLPQRSQPYYERIAPWYPLRAWCHNSFFSALAEGGVILVAALVFYWGGLAWAFWRWTRSTGVARAAAAGALAGLVAMLVNALFHDIFYASETMYGFGFMLGIATALAAE